MSGDFSGEGNVAITVRTAGDAQAPPIDLPNDDLSPDVTGAVPRMRASTSPKIFRNPRHPGKASVQAHTIRKPNERLPEARDAIRRLWKSAQQKATAMVLAATSGDPIELSNAASDLEHTLADMWSLREFRELDWRGVLDFLQGSLKYAWKFEGGYEKLTIEKCAAIKQVVLKHLGPSTIDKENVSSTLGILEEAGFDPWAGISGDPQE